MYDLPKCQFVMHSQFWATWDCPVVDMSPLQWLSPCYVGWCLVDRFVAILLFCTMMEAVGWIQTSSHGTLMRGRIAGRIFHGDIVNATHASQQHCSRLQQLYWCCYLPSSMVCAQKNFAAFHSAGELVITRWQSRVHDLRMERIFFRTRQFHHHDVIVDRKHSITQYSFTIDILLLINSIMAIWYG